jgi:hypothetical protein
MAMMKRKMRIPSEGTFVGDPPLEVGSGSTGLVWRKPGLDPDTRLTVTYDIANPAEIPNLSKTDPMLLSLEPDYLYSIQLDSEIIQQTVTSAGDFIPVFATRDAKTGVWSSWTEVSPSAVDHQIAATAGATLVETRHVTDARIDYNVSAEQDAIAFGLYGEVTASNLSVVGGHCFARVEQYHL